MSQTLKHPNIVRLYDVIETDKYIGIILEYASGGELFDHILAHRYLRERDAAKLFSQLISGVWYIHQKKIVHRDLKLENLLLDKNRNVIITDFGFANRFEHRADDLMQTSCGSPCYAAPELVISEGLYVGSAVDIWSCGVILYAMLAGYLPFDDDPANPDGDNINLLYKYIVNTPLSFPEYVSAEARDILGMMLVPDPARRASLEAVMDHPWLAAYAVPSDNAIVPAGAPTVFGKTVEQLERSAMEQHQQKRLAYQKQMKAAAAAMSATAPVASATVGRSQSHQIDVFANTAGRPGGGGRSRSTQPEYIYDSSADQSYASTVPAPTPPSASAPRRVHGSPAALGLDDDDPFAAPGSVSNANKSNPSVAVTVPSDPSSVTVPSTKTSNSKALAVESTQSPKSTSSHKSPGGGGFRHTIQVEYDDSSPKTGRRSEDRERRAKERGGAQGQGQGQTPQSPNVPPVPRPGNGSVHRERRSSHSMKPLPPSPGPLTSPSSTHRSPPSAPPTTTTPSKNASTSTSPNNTPTSANHSTSRPAAITPPRVTPTVSVNPASPPGTPITFAMSSSGDGERDTASRESSVKGHRKGRSSLDKLGLAKIFGGGSGSNTNDTGTGAQQLNGRVPSVGGMSSGSGNASKNGSSILLSTGSGGEKEKDKEKEKESENDKEPKEGRKSRRNTLTVMVEPLSRTIRGRGSKGRTPTGSADPSSPADARGKGIFRGQPHSAILPSTNGSGGPARGVKSAVEPAPSFAGATGEMGEGTGGIGMHASTSKARKVMQWFRAKSKVREGVPGADEEDARERSGTPTQAEYRKKNAASSSTLHRTSNSPPVAPVQVIVTTPASLTPTTSRVPPPSFPSKSAGHGHPQRTASNATDSSFMSPSLVTRFRNSVTVGGGGGAHHASSNSAKAMPWSSMRIHHGAVDQTTITTKPPPEVFQHVRQVLEGMGVEIQMESEYKYRCVRPKRRKGSMIVGSGSNTPTNLGSVGPAPGSSGSTTGLAAITIVGSAASNGVSQFCLGWLVVEFDG